MKKEYRYVLCVTADAAEGLCTDLAVISAQPERHW